MHDSEHLRVREENTYLREIGLGGYILGKEMSVFDAEVTALNADRSYTVDALESAQKILLRAKATDEPQALRFRQLADSLGVELLCHRIETEAYNLREHTLEATYEQLQTTAEFADQAGNYAAGLTARVMAATLSMRVGTYYQASENVRRGEADAAFAEIKAALSHAYESAKQSDDTAKKELAGAAAEAVVVAALTRALFNELGTAALPATMRQDQARTMFARSANTRFDVGLVRNHGNRALPELTTRIQVKYRENEATALQRYDAGIKLVYAAQAMREALDEYGLLLSEYQGFVTLAQTENTHIWDTLCEKIFDQLNSQNSLHGEPAGEL